MPSKKKTGEKSSKGSGEKKPRKKQSKMLERIYHEHGESNTSETVDNIFALSDSSKENGYASKKLESPVKEDEELFDPEGFVDETSKGSPVDWWEQIPTDEEADKIEAETPIMEENLKLKKTIEELNNSLTILQNRFDAKCAEFDSLAKAYLELKNMKDPPPSIKEQRRMDVIRQNMLRAKAEEERLRGTTWN